MRPVRPGRRRGPAAFLPAGAVAAAVLLAGCGARPGPGPSAPASRPAASPTPVATTQRRVPTHAQAVSSTAATGNACRRNRARRAVIVDISRQRLWMCAQHRLVRESPVTTGMRGRTTRTPTGHYAIQWPQRNTTLTLRSGQTYHVRYWIPFDAPLFGFHDSSWQHFPYGSARYARHGSHGCVHLPLRAIRFLYHWAPVGTPVRIRT